MKILLTHRYFLPDTSPYASILYQIGDALAVAGHDVSIFSTLPSYRSEDGERKTVLKNEKIGKVKVSRSWIFLENKKNILIRILNVLLYCSALSLNILKQRPQIVMAATFPPVIAAWVASFTSKIIGAKFIYHIMDIHPEVSVYSKQLKKGDFITRILQEIDNQTLRRSSEIIVLSEDMKQTLIDRDPANATLPIQIIPNFPSKSENCGHSLDIEGLLKDDGVIRAVFAGNIGRFQNLHALSEGIAECFRDYPNLELVFMGDGVELAGLQEKWADTTQVKFFPFLPTAVAKKIVADAEIGVVSLAPDMYRVAYPSKIETYLDLGVKIFALVEPESEIASQLVKSNIGVVPNSENAGDIADAFRSLLKEGIGAMPSNPKKRKKVASDWETLIAGLEKGE
jgi:glycosyltransferase involved in cell wall biosynthesis